MRAPLVGSDTDVSNSPTLVPHDRYTLNTEDGRSINFYANPAENSCLRGGAKNNDGSSTTLSELETKEFLRIAQMAFTKLSKK